jgi:hypothetical protein
MEHKLLACAARTSQRFFGYNPKNRPSRCHIFFSILHIAVSGAWETSGDLVN